MSTLLTMIIFRFIIKVLVKDGLPFRLQRLVLQVSEFVKVTLFTFPLNSDSFNTKLNLSLVRLEFLLLILYQNSL